MARPLRLELSVGIYHVTSRGDGREDIYLSDADRQLWLQVFAEVCERFNWVCHAWCQMTNHYHLLIETPDANLSLGMRQLNGVYTQRFNRSHDRVGHVFQGRFKGILVERDSYLLELARYVVLNPPDWVLGQFGEDRAAAIAAYVEFVHAGARLPIVWTQLQGQIYLGSEAFVSQMQALVETQPNVKEVPRAQRRGMMVPLADFAAQYPRNEAMTRAFLSGHHTQQAIADHFGVHYTTVSRIIKAHEQAAKG